MKRLMEKIVFSGLVTAWRLATVPTRRSPDCVNATTDGVVRPPSAFSITVGSPPSSTAMHEFVVPRSIPMVLPMWEAPCLRGKVLEGGETPPPHRPWLRRDAEQNLSGSMADSCVLGQGQRRRPGHIRRSAHS